MQTNSMFGSVQKLTPSIFAGASGPVKSAINSSVEHFTAIEGLLTSGKVSTEQLAYATQKLYEAQIAVNSAIAYGWNNGQGAGF